MKRKIRGSFLMALGLLLSLSAAAIFAKYEYQAELAGDNAEILLDGLTEQIQERAEAQRRDTARQEEPAAQMPQTTLAGYGLVGIVRAPSVGLELPVLDEWSYELLQISPCRYSGSAAGGDLILLGHNYKRHFAPLKKLEDGSVVEFCDINGGVYRYEVAVSEILQKTELERLTTSDYDLTLFTCTNGGYSRYVVRCTLVSAPGDKAPGTEAV